MPYGISGLWYVALLSPVPGLVGLHWPDLFLLTWGISVPYVLRQQTPDGGRGCWPYHRNPGLAWCSLRRSRAWLAPWAPVPVCHLEKLLSLHRRKDLAPYLTVSHFTFLHLFFFFFTVPKHTFLLILFLKNTIKFKRWLKSHWSLSNTTYLWLWEEAGSR